MSAGGAMPIAGPGGQFFAPYEYFEGDPTVSPGLARPIGWRVLMPDGTGAWDKTGPLDTDWSFVGVGTTPTLASVYAAGSSARSTADLMGMNLGTTMRFQANGDARSLPLVGAYETASSKSLAATGLPARLDSLAVDLSLLIGGRLFDWYQMFDPLWNGTFAQLAGYSWITESVSFTQAAQTSFLGSNRYGERAWAAAKNYGPPSTPPHTLGAPGDALFHQLALYNGVDAAMRNVEQVDGFGSVLRELSPSINGVVYQWATHWRHQNIVTAIGDGVGWGVWNGDFNHGGDVPQAALVARTTTADPTNDWLWALQLRDTAGSGQLGDVVTFARTGIAFNAPVVADGLTVVAQTALLDLTTVADNIPISIPQRAGYYFCPFIARLELKDATGTATAGTLTISYGNDAAHSNSGSTALSVATFNAIAPIVPALVTIGAGPSQMIDSATAFKVKISAVLTGVTAAHGRLAVIGFWVPV